MKVFISDNTKTKLMEMIKSGKGGSISVRKYNPQTDPITNVINGINLEDSHRAKHKTNKYYTIYISKAKLATYGKVEGEGLMDWLPKILKGVVKYAPTVVSTISDVVSSHKQNTEQARHNAELEKIARGEALKCGVQEGGFLGSLIPALVGAVPALFDIFSKVGSGLQEGGDLWSALDTKGNGSDMANTMGSVGNIFGTIMGTLFGSGYEVDKKLSRKIVNKMIKMHNSGKTFNHIQFGKSILPGLMRGIVADQKYKGTYKGEWKDPFTYPLPDLTPDQIQARIDDAKAHGISVTDTPIQTRPIVAMPQTSGSGCKCFVNATQGIDDNMKNSLRHIFRVLKQFYKIKQSKKGNGLKLTHRGQAIYLNPQ